MTLTNRPHPAPGASEEQAAAPARPEAFPERPHHAPPARRTPTQRREAPEACGVAVLGYN